MSDHEDYGQWAVVGVYKTEKEAQEVLHAIRARTYTGRKPWDGYFERIEKCYAETVKVGQWSLPVASPPSDDFEALKALYDDHIDAK